MLIEEVYLIRLNRKCKDNIKVLFELIAHNLNYNFDELIELSQKMKSEFPAILNSLIIFISSVDEAEEFIFVLIDMICIIDNKEISNNFCDSYNSIVNS